MRPFRQATVAIVLCAFSTIALSAITDDQAGQIAAKTAKRFQSASPIEKVEVSKAERNKFTYGIWYKGNPSLGQLSGDTKGLIRETLKELKAAGLNTAETPVFIHAHAYKKVQGETRDMVRVYGKASYNFNSDSIEFKVEK